MNKNFLFVVPRYAQLNQPYYFPMGLGYVISNMKKNGFNVSILNLCNYGESIESLLSESIKKHDIDIVCTGAMSMYWNEVDDVLKAVKNIDKNIKTVVGGALITSDPVLALENMQIDFGVMGEGEETVVDLADALCNDRDVKTVPGIAYVDDGGIIHVNDPRPPIADLDSLPFPDYEGLEFDKWLDMIAMQEPSRDVDLSEIPRRVDITASRSCPFKCTFCYHPLGNKYRQRSLDNVFREIDYLKENYNITFINVQDELFSMDEKRVIEFATRIKEYNIKWTAQWRVDNVSEDILKILKDSNLQILGLGVESLSDTVLKSMRKKTSRALIEQAYSLCDKVGVRPGGNIIIGDVAETRDTIKESLTWLKNHPEHDLSLAFVLAIPDSEIWRYALNKGLIKDKLDFIKKRFPIINLTGMTDKQFLRIQRKIRIDNIKKKYTIYGKLISSEKTGKLYKDREICDITVKCPICSNESKYLYPKYSYLPFSILLCKHCYKRLKIPTRKAFNEPFLTGLNGFLLLYRDIVYFGWLREDPRWNKFSKSKFFRNGMKFLRKLGVTIPESAMDAD